MINITLRQEVDMWYIIPAIRRDMARVMKSQGMRQREIARFLHVTDAAVSQYMSKKRARSVRFSADFKPHIRDSFAKILAGESLQAELMRLCELCYQDGITCGLHKRKGAPRDCRMCKDIGGEEKEK